MVDVSARMNCSVPDCQFKRLEVLIVPLVFGIYLYTKDSAGPVATFTVQWTDVVAIGRSG